MLTRPTLDEKERIALFRLGECLGLMDWLTIYTEDTSVREGVTRTGGQVHRVDNLSPDAYDKVILYRIAKGLPSNEDTTVANVDTFHKLNIVLDEAFKELYRRGIIE